MPVPSSSSNGGSAGSLQMENASKAHARQIFVADCQLVGAAIAFGLGFCGQKEAMMEHVGPITFNAVRYLLSTFLLAVILPFLPSRGKSKERDESQDTLPLLGIEKDFSWSEITTRPITSYSPFVKCVLFGTALAFFNFLGSTFQQVGIQNTSASESAFLTGFYVVFTPLIQVLAPTLSTLGTGSSIPSKPPKWNTWLAVCLSMLGLFIISGSSMSRIKLGTGEVLTLIAAFFWTFFILLMDVATDHCDSVYISFAQLLGTALLSIFASYFFEAGEWNFSHLFASWPVILFLGAVECIGFTLGALGQTYSPPHHAAIIYGSEVVWATMGGYLFLKEELSNREAIGCTLMIVATVCAKIECKGSILKEFSFFNTITDFFRRKS